MPILHTPWTLTLDGIDLADRSTSWTLTRDIDYVHDQIEVQGFGRDIYFLADPSVRTREGRIRLDIEGDDFVFLLESRDGDEQSWTLRGRTLSALADAPHADPVSVSGPGLVSTMAMAMSPVPLLWQTHTWVLPADYAFSGTPIEGITQLAQAVGAIVQWINHVLVVRPRFPVRATSLAGVAPDVEYDRSRMVNPSMRLDPAGQYNAIEVTSADSSSDAPTLELETENPRRGHDLLVRAWFAQDAQAADAEKLVTSGAVQDLGWGAAQESEVVEFSHGQASLSRPVESLFSVAWIGAVGGDIAWTRGGRELSIPGQGPALARVGYATRFRRMLLYAHDVEELLLQVSLAPSARLGVLCVAGSGPAVESPDTISESLLTDQAGALARGQSWLDANYYARKTVTFSAPFRREAIPGGVAFLDDAELGAFGNYLILRASIRQEGPQVIQEPEVVQCQP